MAFSFAFTFRRVFVLLVALALIIISAIGLARGGSTGYMIVKIVILVIAVLGLLGAMNDNPRYLQLFLLLLTALLIWEIIYILVQAIQYKATLSSLGYDIALAVLLAIGVVFTADITRISWGSRDIVI